MQVNLLSLQNVGKLNSSTFLLFYSSIPEETILLTAKGRWMYVITLMIIDREIIVLGIHCPSAYVSITKST
jgi:hypothetical protein